MNWAKSCSEVECKYSSSQHREVFQKTQWLEGFERKCEKFILPEPTS